MRREDGAAGRIGSAHRDRSYADPNLGTNQYRAYWGCPGGAGAPQMGISEYADCVAERSHGGSDRFLRLLPCPPSYQELA